MWSRASWMEANGRAALPAAAASWRPDRASLPAAAARRRGARSRLLLDEEHLLRLLLQHLRLLGSNDHRGHER